MTISTTGVRTSSLGNGVTTDFTFPYRFLEDTDLDVTLIDSVGNETPQTLGTHYTVTGAGGDAGGTVQMATPPASGETLLIVRTLDVTQETDYISGDAFPAETHETALDRLTMIAQQQGYDLSRSLKIKEVDQDGSVNTELPSPEAYKYIRWNATEDGFENTEGTIDFAGAANVESVTLTDGQTVVPFVNAVAVASFVITGPDADNGRLLETVDFSIDSVNNTVILAQSYPAGTIITMVYVNLESDAANSLSGVIAYPTLTALRGAMTYSGAVSYLKGRDDVGDGGAGEFIWDSSDLSAEVAADTQSGIYVAPSSDLTGASGAWVRQYSGAVNVKWFGAKGDGVTDDTAAIQAAVNYFDLSFIPVGEFIVRNLQITNSIVGEDKELSQLICKDYGITITGSDIAIRALNINMDGGYFDTFSNQGLISVIEPASNITIENCNVGNFSVPEAGASPVSGHNNFYAVYLYSASGVGFRGIKIKSCKFSDMEKYTSGGATATDGFVGAIYMSNLWDSGGVPNWDIVISNNEFYNIYNSFIGTSYEGDADAIRYYSTSGYSNTSSIVITDNYFNGVMKSAVKVSGGSGVTIDGIVVVSNLSTEMQAPVRLQYSDNSVVRNLTAYGDFQYGITMSGDGVTFENIVFEEFNGSSSISQYLIYLQSRQDGSKNYIIRNVKARDINSFFLSVTSTWSSDISVSDVFIENVVVDNNVAIPTISNIRDIDNILFKNITILGEIDDVFEENNSTNVFLDSINVRYNNSFYTIADHSKRAASYRESRWSLTNSTLERLDVPTVRNIDTSATTPHGYIYCQHNTFIENLLSPTAGNFDVVYLVTKDLTLVDCELITKQTTDGYLHKGFSVTSTVSTYINGLRFIEDIAPSLKIDALTLNTGNNGVVTNILKSTSDRNCIRYTDGSNVVISDVTNIGGGNATGGAGTPALVTASIINLP
jgi:hypothetical protein